MASPCIVWIRNDLRLSDNPALLAACKTNHPLIVCFIWSEEEEMPYPLGAASRAWLHDSLIQLSQSLHSRLILRKGKYLDVLQEIIGESGARAIFWNRRYEPHHVEKDKEILQVLTLGGIQVETYAGNLLFEPWEVATTSGRPFKVFTPFYKTVAKLEQSKLDPPSPQEAPKKLIFYSGQLHAESIQGLALLTKNPPLDIWQPGEEGARMALTRFIKEKLQNYSHSRDIPMENGTSRLSPHLHFGEISPRQVVHELSAFEKEPFYRELLWREFAAHLLYHFPLLPKMPLKKQFQHFSWRKDPEQRAQWQEGLTGYPIVDAGMRELMATGWMHNRVRMIAGSFLVKQLLLSWLEGEAWFWDKLFDADLASNSFNWQWVAGCGTDSAPNFCIFNPILQGQKFDPEGRYVKHWIPELRAVDVENIHTPWRVKVSGYPPPIVDLEFARMRALEALQDLNNSSSP